MILLSPPSHFRCYFKNLATLSFEYNSNTVTPLF
nr:MAG TPA: hypothetical protein [Caudoviricetes sp.]